MVPIYAIVLGACLLATLPLEPMLSLRVYRSAARLAAAVVPTALVFVAWDVAAVRAGWWSFDPDAVLAPRLLGGLPVEEVLFFVDVPVCAVLTLEAVRAVRPQWFEQAAR